MKGASKKALDDIRKVGSNNIIISSVKPIEEEDVSGDRHTWSPCSCVWVDI